jgi:hypothetical protein
MTMLIDRIRPELVGEKSALPTCLRAEGASRGLPGAELETLLAIVFPEILACGCFRDRLTGLWRYEFGDLHQVGDQWIFGTHLWPLIYVLFDVLACAQRRLSPRELAAYLQLLTDRRKHLEYLAEMFPMLRVDQAIPAEHEAGGLGVGNRTIDWAVGPLSGRRVLLDVKRRFADFIELMGSLSTDDASTPGHDVGLLFRSVERKFKPSNPDELLQGAWIVTDIKQEEAELRNVFKALDASKVHFAILGDERPDGYLIVQRPQDTPFLCELLRLTESRRFVFEREPSVIP